MFATLLHLSAAIATPARATPAPSTPSSATLPAPAGPPHDTQRQGAPAPPPRYDTRAITSDCPIAPTGEIIVCGARLKDRYRLPKLPPDNPRFGPAEFAIAGARVGVETERGNIGSIPTNRIMARVKIRF